MTPASGIYCIIWHLQVWPAIGNSGQPCSRITSLQGLVQYMSELRDLALVYHVMSCKAFWDKIGQIWSNVAYNGPVFVIVSRYDILGPCLSLYYHFCVLLALYVKFDHITIKVPGKREGGLKWTISIQYEPLKRDVTIYGHIRHNISNSEQFSTSAPEKATYGLWRLLVADTA